MADFLFQDTSGVIKTVANFLNKPLTEKQVEFIKDYCSFDKMKKNKSTNHSWFKTLGVCTEDGDFIRKGNFVDIQVNLTIFGVNLIIMLSSESISL